MEGGGGEGDPGFVGGQTESPVLCLCPPPSEDRVSAESLGFCCIQSPMHLCDSLSDGLCSSGCIARRLRLRQGQGCSDSVAKSL